MNDYGQLKQFLIPFVEENLEPSPNAGRGMYVCPLCKSGTGEHGTGAFNIYSSNGVPAWKCHACGEGGDTVDLYAKMYGLDSAQAAAKLAELFNVRWENHTKPHQAAQAALPAEPGKADSANLVKRWLDSLSSDVKGNANAMAYLRKHGINIGLVGDSVLLFNGSKSQVEAWQSEWGHTPSVGSLIFPYPGSPYFEARALSDETKAGRWRKPKSALGRQPLYVANLQNATAVVVVEGVADAAAVLSHLGGNPVAVVGGGGTSVARAASELLARAENQHLTVIEAFDLDEPGRNGARNLRELLPGRVCSLWSFIQQEKLGSPLKDVAEFAGFYGQELSEAIDLACNPAKRLTLTSVGKSGVDAFLAEVAAQDGTEITSTGIAEIDEAIDGGLQAGLYVLGAVSSLGKTTLALQIADNISANGRDALIFSLEQSRGELIAKSLSRFTAQISRKNRGDTTAALTALSISKKQRREGWLDIQKNAFAAAVDAYKEKAGHLWIYEGMGDIGVAQIAATVSRHVEATGVAPLVVVDYLQILSPVMERGTDKQNTDRAVTELKRLARNFSIPVLAISSLNRASYSQAISMEAFKESGAIEYGSDVLLGLQIKGMESQAGDSIATANRNAIKHAKGKATREMELHVLKNRNGITGAIVELTFEAAFSLFQGGFSSPAPKLRI